MIAAARDFLARIGREKFYSPIYIARAYTAIGTTQMAKGQYAAAADTFAQSIAATAGQEPSRWQMWNLLRYAQSLDILGRREEALVVYNEIIHSKQNWGIDDIARKYLNKSYTSAIALAVEFRGIRSRS